jgi:hypothetical protein
VLRDAYECVVLEGEHTPVLVLVLFSIVEIKHCRGCSHPHGQVVLYSLDYLVVNVRCYVVTLSLGCCRIQILKVPCANESPISDATVQVLLNRFLATTVGANLSRVV